MLTYIITLNSVSWQVYLGFNSIRIENVLLTSLPEMDAADRMLLSRKLINIHKGRSVYKYLARAQVSDCRKNVRGRDNFACERRVAVEEEEKEHHAYAVLLLSISKGKHYWFWARYRPTVVCLHSKIRNLFLIHLHGHSYISYNSSCEPLQVPASVGIFKRCWLFFNWKISLRNTDTRAGINSWCTLMYL